MIKNLNDFIIYKDDILKIENYFQDPYSFPEFKIRTRSDMAIWNDDYDEYLSNPKKQSSSKINYKNIQTTGTNNMSTVNYLKFVILDLEEDAPTHLVWESESFWSKSLNVEDFILKFANEINESIEKHNKKRDEVGLKSLDSSQFKKQVLTSHSWTLSKSTKKVNKED